MRVIDYSVLSRQITHQELAEFRLTPIYNDMFRSTRRILWAFVVVLSIVGGLVITGPIVELLVSSVVLQILIIVFLTLFIGTALWCMMRAYFSHSERHMLRFVLFAHANGLRYDTSVQQVDHTGLIFSLGDNRRLYNRFIEASEERFEIGNYQFSTGSGKNRKYYQWGYICIRLERNVPHMVLDAMHNNTTLFGFSLSNLPTSFDKDQTLSLEGDFNSHFTLYAPKEYERDALYIFTPDLMALLIDTTARYDIETVDDRLYVYSPEMFNLRDQKTLETIFSIIDIVGTKTVDRTERYADERIGDRSVDRITAQGSRLRTTFPVVAVVTVIITALFYILMTILSVI